MKVKINFTHTSARKYPVNDAWVCRDIANKGGGVLCNSSERRNLRIPRLK